MRISKLAAAAMLGVAALGLSACATSLNTTVSRYQAMPAPQGQTLLRRPGRRHGRERRARIPALCRHWSRSRCRPRGYTPATEPRSATMVVQLGYGVDHGQAASSSTIRSRRSGYGGSTASVLSIRASASARAFYYGWNDPFWYGGGRRQLCRISQRGRPPHPRRGNNQPLFDGHAQARSQTNRLDMRGAEPGRSDVHRLPRPNGETVKITIPTKPQVVKANPLLARAHGARRVACRRAFSFERNPPDAAQPQCTGKTNSQPEEFRHDRLESAPPRGPSPRPAPPNSVAILIPCHRVIRANGSLGGYRWGVRRKARLLRRAKRVQAP